MQESSLRQPSLEYKGDAHMSKAIAAVGDRDSILLFQAVGINTVIAENQQDIEHALRHLEREGYSLIYITERAAQMVKETINEYKNQPFPIVIPVPSRLGIGGAGMDGIRRNVIKAVGKEIF